MKRTPHTKQSFPIEKEYARCVSALNFTGILEHLPNSSSMGVIGMDGKEYPTPTREQVLEVFVFNKEVVERKISQGFVNLELTPMAMPMTHLMDVLKAAICKHATEGKIFQTRRSLTDALIPVRVNSEKLVWIWETLRLTLDTNALVYFPQDYSIHHQGKTKLEIINDGRICAVPGWSISLVENSPILPPEGKGKILGGRRQLELGHSPREYLQILKSEEYQGETGETLEDFIMEFLMHLETTNEINNDVDDNNALWCLGQYFILPYAEVVPTGRWIRDLGRVRLDAHRTGNKQCTKSYGVSTMVRLRRG